MLWYPAACNASTGNWSSGHFVSCRQTMSGFVASSQANNWSWRLRRELMFHDAILIFSSVGAVYLSRRSVTRAVDLQTRFARRLESALMMRDFVTLINTVL